MQKNTSTEKSQPDHGHQNDRGPTAPAEPEAREPNATQESPEIPTPEPASWPRHLATGLRLLLLSVLLCSVAYPAVLLLAGAAFWGDSVRGGILERDGKPVGSRLIGQSFSADVFFHPRPSSKGYDGMDSGSQNLGPYSEALTERVTARLKELQQQGIAAESVPVGWVTESGSALDPHITPAAARLQVPRVSRASSMPPRELEKLIESHTEGRWAGFFGQERVNVLLLNMEIKKRLGEPE